MGLNGKINSLHLNSNKALKINSMWFMKPSSHDELSLVFYSFFRDVIFIYNV